MSDYSNTFGGAAKDAANDIILGSDFDTEFDAIATASATKANKTGAPATTNNLAMLTATGDLADSLVESDGSGNITANVTGNLTGNVTGDVTGNLTGTASAVAAGAVDTAQLAAGAVQRAKIQTATVSLAGTLNNGANDITLNPYAFFPMIHVSDQLNEHLTGHSVDGASADSPRLGFYNNGTADTYDIDYRYIDA